MTMKKLVVREAKTCLSKLLVKVEKGEQLIMILRGLAMARLTGATPAAAWRAQGNAQRERVS